MSLSKQTILDVNPRAAIFYDHLFENPEVCSGCYTKIRHIEPLPDKAWGSRLATRPDEHRHITPAGDYGHDSYIPRGRHSHDATWYPTVYCGDCGRDGTADAHAPPKTQLMTYAANIRDYLHEWTELRVDIDRMRDTINRLKSDPRAESRSTEIMALSTAHGIERTQ